MYIDSFKKEATNKDYSLCGFGNVLIASQAKGSAKSVTFPLGFDESAPDTNLAFKVVFSQGHDASNSTDYMTLNGIQVDANVNGTLQPLPIHAMDESGTTVYKVLDPNTVLEMYYTSDDGSGNPAFVVIGNPLVLSSTTYSIYANGWNEFVNNCELSDWENITIPLENTNPMIADYDGFIIPSGVSGWGNGGANAQADLFINGINITVISVYSSTSATNAKGGSAIPIKRGDSIYVTVSGSGGSDNNSLVAYYKKRDYSNR